MSHVCARCPKALGASCCEVKEDEYLALLTGADIRRIGEHVRRRPEHFVEEEWVERDEALEYEARRPLYRGYFRHSLLRRSLKRRDGACVFLDRETGCTLPAEVKPTACLLYPFEQVADGSWSVAVARYGSLEAAKGQWDACLAVEEAKRMADVLRAFGTTRPEVEALGERLRREVQAGE